MKTFALVSTLFLFSILIFPKDCFGQNKIFSDTNGEITWRSVSSNSARCMDVNSKGYIFAGTWGILISKDNGNNWIKKDLPNTNYEINTITIDKNDIIYTTTFDHKLFRSADDGMTWVQLFPDSAQSFTCVAVNLNDEIFVGTEYSGLYQVNKACDSLKVTGWNNAVEQLSISNNNDMFILSYQVYRSIDNSKNWILASAGLTNTGINAFAHNSLGHVFVGTAGDRGGVFRSINKGDQWIVSKYSFLTEMDSVVTSLACNSADEIFIGSFGKGISKLSSDGTNLISINKGLPQPLPIVLSFCFTPDGHLLTGTFSGIFKSEQVVTPIQNDINFNDELCSLDQNFPNPFDSKTVIQYSLSQEVFVRIDVLNLHGQLVETLLNKHQQPGVYQELLDASAFVPGIYFYRMRAGDIIITRKMQIKRK